MPKYVETPDDLNKKYHGTFVKYKDEFVSIANFVPGPERGSVVAAISRAKGGAHNETIEVDKLEAITFDSMFVNNSDLTSSRKEEQMIPATLFLRLPRRQWRRGLSQDNTKLKCPMSTLYATIGRSFENFDHNLSIPLLKRLEVPKYPTLRHAVDMLFTFQAVAISPMFCLCLSNISRERCLITSIFGFVGEATHNAIYVKHPPVLQELRDFVSRTNQSVTVEAI